MLKNTYLSTRQAAKFLGEPMIRLQQWRTRDEGPKYERVDYTIVLYHKGELKRFKKLRGKQK